MDKIKVMNYPPTVEYIRMTDRPRTYINGNNIKSSVITMNLTPPDKPELQWVYQTRNYHSCPICKIGLLDTRVQRDPFVKYVLFFKDIKRYRCNNCYSKVYIRSSKKND